MLTYLGPSSDGRTNRWSIKCPKCGTIFYPTTTMLANRHEQCPRMSCLSEMLVNYNDRSVTLLSRESK